jgi:membrane fusion protein, multidrug efflux system
MRGPILYINIAHFLDHYFLLIFPTAVLAIAPAWGMGYGEALALATPGFVAFALATPAAGWLGDRYGEAPLMAVFFIGIGLASVATGLAAGPVSLAIGLTAIGLFASIYHPVGTAYLVRLAARTGAALGVNGVFGNLGVAAAAGLTGVITAIEPGIRETTRTFEVQATFDNPDHQLRPGMFGRAQVDIGEPATVKLVPQTAMQFNPYGNSVFVIREEGEELRVTRRFVRTGERRGDLIEVIDGLEVGERVATSGLLKLRNDAVVVLSDNGNMAPTSELNPRPENQ